MPIVNGAYDAPTWNNNAPPAIDASELQDMCDTIETYNTQKADVDYVNTFVRPNLLDNAYFVGGGSQQGGGQFPINQRGATSYSGTVYMIDRWTGFGAQTRLDLTSGGVKLYRASTSDSGRLTQYLDPGILSSLEGKTVTISALFDTIPSSDGALLMMWNNVNIGQVAIGASSPKLVSKTITVPTSGYSTSDALYQRIQCSTNALSAGAGVIKAMKLEIGSTQTLAHQENGVWVLNEIPNFEAELAKCQRYDYLNSNGMSQFIRASYIAANAIYFDFPVPLPMRAGVAYTVLSSGQIGVFNMAGAAQTGFTFTVQNAYGGSLRITAAKTSHGLSDAYLTVTKVLFSSDL